MTIEKLLTKLEKVTRSGRGFMALCPAHKDHHPSLSITRSDSGKILLHCHGGCSFDQILQAIGVSRSELYERVDEQRGRTDMVYDYRGRDGKLLYQVIRWRPKKFTIRRPDPNIKTQWIYNLHGVQPVLYRWPELIGARPEATVFIVEGEQDVENLRRRGLIATTNSGGAGRWRPEFAKEFQGRAVAVLPDNDPPGKEHAAQVARSLQEFARSIKVIELPGLPAKGDVSDWLANGHDTEDLNQLIKAAPEWSLSPVPDPAARSCIDKLGDQWPEFMDKINERAHKGYSPLKTTIPSLDLLLGGGIPRGQATLICGPPGCGKTSWSIGLGLTFACGHDGGNCIFWSLELCKEEIISRMVSLQRDLCWEDVREGKHLQECHEVGQELWEVPFIILDRSAQMDDLKTEVLRQRQQHDKPLLVIVDYVQQIDIDGDSSESRIKVERVSGRLLKLAVEHDITLVELSSVGRASYKNAKAGKRPQLNTVLMMARETGRLESDAGVMIGMVNVGLPSRENGRQKLWLAVAKNRMGGAIGMVAAEYDGRSGRFLEIDEAELLSKKNAPAKDYRQLAIEALRKAYSSGKPITSLGQLREIIGGGAEAVRNAIKTLEADGIVIKVARGYRVVERQTLPSDPSDDDSDSLSIKRESESSSPNGLVGVNGGSSSENLISGNQKAKSDG